MVRPNGTKSARLIQVIETVAKRGLGTKKDPERYVKQYWDLDGNFLAESDLHHYIQQIEHETNALEESLVTSKAEI